MPAVVEVVNGLERCATIKVDWNDVIAKEDVLVVKYCKEAVVPGFRPGKASPKIIRDRFGSSLRAEVLEQLMRKTFEEMVKAEDQRVAGLLSFEPEPVVEGQPFIYKATFEVFPDIAFNDLKGQKISHPVASVTADDVTKTLDELRKKHMTWEPVTRKVKDGDRLLINLAGFDADGVAMANATGDNFEVVIGSKKTIPGFEEGHVGAKKGDDRELNLVFPENYGEKQLAGKPVKFKIHVNEVFAPVLPEVDDEFAKKFVKEGGVKALHQEFKESMERELGKALRGKRKQAVFTALLEANQVDIPRTMLQSEIGRLREGLVRDMQRYTRSKQSYPTHMLPDEMFTEKARNNIALGLLLGEAIKKFELRADSKKVRELLEEQAAAYDNPDEVVRYYYSNEKALEDFEQLALEEQVVDKLLENAILEDLVVDYFEAMGRNHAEHDDGEAGHVHGPDCDHDHDDHVHGPDCDHDHN